MHTRPLDGYFWRIRSFIIIIGNLSTRRSWFTNGMAGRAELDRGRSLRAKCKSLSNTTWNHHERRQNNSVENAFQRFALSFVSFLRRKHDFRRRISTFVWRILFEEPRIWTSGFNLRTRVLNSVTAALERLHMRSGCYAAKILPVGVRGTKNVWWLSSLLMTVWARLELGASGLRVQRSNRSATLPPLHEVDSLQSIFRFTASWNRLCS